MKALLQTVKESHCIFMTFGGRLKKGGVIEDKSTDKKLFD
jgi:hypothetical protein